MTTAITNPYGAQPLETTRPLSLYPLAAALPAAPTAVEVNLGLTHVVRRYYTQRGGLCVSFSACQALTFFNGRLYHPGWSFYRSGGDPNSGTSTVAVMDQLRRYGNLVVSPPYPELAPEDDVRALTGDPSEGIRENRWLSTDGAQALTDIRTTLSLRIPVLFVLPVYGVTEASPDRAYWDCPDAPRSAGWHQICLTYASDAESFIGSPNSWGDGPMYGFTYDTLVRFINIHHAYGTVITDNLTGTEGPMPADPIPTPVPTPAPTFTCPYCGKALRTKARLRRHVRRKHR